MYLHIHKQIYINAKIACNLERRKYYCRLEKATLKLKRLLVHNLSLNQMEKRVLLVTIKSQYRIEFYLLFLRNSIILSMSNFISHNSSMWPYLFSSSWTRMFLRIFFISGLKDTETKKWQSNFALRS